MIDNGVGPVLYAAVKRVAEGPRSGLPLDQDGDIDTISFLKLWINLFLEDCIAQDINPLDALVEQIEHLKNNQALEFVPRSADGFTAQDLAHILTSIVLTGAPNEDQNLVDVELYQVRVSEMRTPSGYTLKKLLHLIKGTKLMFSPDGSVEAARAEFSQITPPARKHFPKRALELLMDHGLEIGVDVKQDLWKVCWPDLLQFRASEKERRKLDSAVVKQTGSRYMASTILSDKKIEGIIQQFLSNKTIRAASASLEISKKAVKLYYDAILDRLYNIGFYRPQFYFRYKLLMSQNDILDKLDQYVSDQMKMHRGLSTEGRLKYEAKYYTHGFYSFYLSRAFTHDDIDDLIERIMFNDVKHLTRMTGQLNRPMFNLPIAEEFIRQGLNRRVTKPVRDKIQKNSLRIVKSYASQSENPDILDYIASFIGDITFDQRIPDDDRLKAFVIMSTMVDDPHEADMLLMRRPVI